jgi:hypothetical protein
MMPIRLSLFIFICTFGTLKGIGQFSYQYLEVLYDSAWTYKNLQVVPIRFKAARGVSGKSPTIGLQEALLMKKVQIKELPDKVGSYKGGVMITNKSKKSILIHSGDMITGGKQDRILPKTMVIAPGEKKEVLTVFCIEKDRWDEKPRPFFYGGSGDWEIRKIIDTKKSQAAVWKEIERQYSLAEQSSKTWSYYQLHSDTAKKNEYAKYFRERYDESDKGFAGFLFITGQEIMAVELFSKQDYTEASFDAMLGSYINSLSNESSPPMVPQPRQKRFLDNVLASKDSQGRLIRSQGAQHKYENVTIHMVVYGNGF